MSRKESKDQEVLRKEAERKHLEVISDLQKILNMPEGVRYFKHLAEEGYIFRTTYTGNANTYFNEGMRNFALMILGEVVEANKNVLLKLLIKDEKEVM